MLGRFMLLTLAIWLVEAIVLWSIGPRPWRFSLRALLIAMTVTALLMGIIASSY